MTTKATKTENYPQPLTTKDDKKTSSEQPLTTPEIDIETVFVSSSEVLVNYYYLFNNDNKNNTKWLTVINHYNFKENFPKWIEISFKPEYMKIVYHLKVNEFCHAKGLQKLFHDNINTCVYRLNKLEKYRIIESVINKQKYENILYKHRQAFRIDDWHYDKAEWYHLTDLGNNFFSRLDYTVILHPFLMEQIKNYTDALRKTTDKINREIKTADQFIDDALLKYKIKLEKQPDTDEYGWAEGVIESLFRRTGVVIDMTPDELLDKVKTKLEGERKR